MRPRPLTGMDPYWHNLFARLQEVDAPAPWGLRAAASGLAACYGLGARLRRELYGRGLLPARRLPAPVVSVGNLTVGGAGKTPMTAFLTRRLMAAGRRVAILSRGYGGASKGVVRLSDGARVFAKPPAVGEEAYWLARALPGAAVYTGACRLTAGLAAWQEFKPDLFLLDDGFQHFQLHRDLDLVLLDAASPFGNGRLLPRGPLREPLSALATAQALILTRFQAGVHDAVLAHLQDSFPDKIILTAAITPAAAQRFPDGGALPPEALGGLALFAFAGLARPQVFARTLTGLGVTLTGFRAFPDHHAYRAPDLAQLVREARTQGAAALITTSKDWARLGETWEADLPLWVLEVEARVPEADRIMELLAARDRNRRAAAEPK
jgi:tetraacyldisaccharide 4'-kinase